jgi:hypothetical protein
MTSSACDKPPANRRGGWLSTPFLAVTQSGFAWKTRTAVDWLLLGSTFVRWSNPKTMP